MQSVSPDRIHAAHERSPRAAWVAGVAAVAWMLVLQLGLARHGPFAAPIASIGRLHPLIVHVPIGVLVLVAISEVYALRGRGSLLGTATGATLWLAALGAIGAYTAGSLLSHEGGYEPATVLWHGRLAAGIVLGAFASLAVYHHAESTESDGTRRAYLAVLGATLLVMTVGAHLGGSLSHGPTFLTENLPGPVRRLLEPRPAPSASATTSSNTVFTSLVQPVLERRCTGCHGEHKAKGGLRLDSLAAIRKGGEHGRIVVPGNAAKSEIVKRLLLPLDDEHHMPPESKAQPTSDEIALVRTWIDTGAQDAMPVSDFPGGTPAILPRTAPEPAAPHAAASAEAAQPRDAPVASGAAPAVPEAPASSHATASAEPAASVPDLASGSGPAVDVWERVVRPIFSARCGNCHGPVNHKAKLRLDDFDAALRGGEHGRVIVPGKPASSPLLRRVLAAMDDDDHMPPSSRPQPTTAELAAIRWWIKSGAPRTAPLPNGLSGAAPEARSRPSVSSNAPAASNALAEQNGSQGAADTVPSTALPGATPASAPAEVASGRLDPSAEADAGAGQARAPSGKPPAEHTPPGCGCALGAQPMRAQWLGLGLVAVWLLRRRSARAR